MTQLIDFMNEVLKHTGRAELTADELDSERMNQDQKFVLETINDKQKQIANEYEFKELHNTDTFTTESGTAQYTLQGKEISTSSGSRYKRPHPKKLAYFENRDLNNDKIYQATRDEFHYFEYHNDTGEPDYWRLLDVNEEGLPIIEFAPTPDGQHNIFYEYYERPKKLKNSTDPIEIDERALKWGSIEAILEFDGVDFQRARAEFQRALKSARGNDSGADVRVGGNAGRGRRHPLDNVDLPLG